MIKKHGHHGDIRPADGKNQRCLSILAVRIGVGTAVEQEMEERVIALLRRVEERGVAAIVALGIDVGSAFEQQLDNAVVPESGREA